MRLDLTGAHAPRIHGDDLLIKAPKPPLSLGYDLWLETALPVPRRFQLQFTKIPLQLLAATSVTTVSAVATGWLMLLIAQMLGHLCLQGPFQNRFGQLPQQSVFTHDVFWLLVPSQQLVNKRFVDHHRAILLSRWHLHTSFYILSTDHGGKKCV